MFDTNLRFDHITDMMDANLHWIEIIGPVDMHPRHPNYIRKGVDPPGYDDHNNASHRAKISISHLIEFTLAERYFSIKKIEHIPDMIMVIHEFLDWQKKNQTIDVPEVALYRKGCVMLLLQLRKYVKVKSKTDRRLQIADTILTKLKKQLKL